MWVATPHGLAQLSLLFVYSIQLSLLFIYSIQLSLLFVCSIQETADVEFVVKGKSIHAHKMLLILRCDYFKSMFSEGTWKESKERSVEATEMCMKDL